MPKNDWSHEKVYQALVNRGERVKSIPNEPYVTIYSQEYNCAVLYSPATLRYRSAPLHLNENRPGWRADVNERIQPALEKVRKENKGPGKEGQNFTFYRVLDWGVLAAALGLVSVGAGTDLANDATTITAAMSSANRIEKGTEQERKTASLDEFQGVHRRPVNLVDRHLLRPVDFYATISDCANTSAECPGIVNSCATGWPPRGFFTEADATSRSPGCLQDPGHLLPGEALLYQGRTGGQIARIHVDYVRRTFKGKNDSLSEARRSTTFHKNLIRYLSFFLDVPAEQIFRHAAYTNLVKCSTVGERGSFKSQDDGRMLLASFHARNLILQAQVAACFWQGGGGVLNGRAGTTPSRAARPLCEASVVFLPKRG